MPWLMLDRRKAERVIIGEGTPHEVIITVVSLRRAKVTLGFEADRNIRIDRGEVAARIRQEGELRRRES